MLYLLYVAGLSFQGTYHRFVTNQRQEEKEVPYAILLQKEGQEGEGKEMKRMHHSHLLSDVQFSTIKHWLC